jgi:DNA (cytosine-5)-methyltransferase 1
MMTVLHHLDLFSGYGGFSLGLTLAGLQMRTVMYVEWERYPQEIIKARIKDGFLDDAPIWGDISTLDGQQLRGVVDLITAGFPCQPHSVAGQKRGASDERNLWPETLRVIREVEPRYVILENVPGLLSASSDGGTPAYGGTVVGELASLGYSVHWRTIGAEDVGAPHRRKRWWCIGVADSSDGRRTSEGGEQPRIYASTELSLESPDRGRQLADADSDSVWDGQQLQGQRRPASSAQSRAGHTDEELADSKSKGSELEGVWANGHQEGRQEPYGSVGLRSRAIPTWPPSPSDADGWAELLAERPDLAPALNKEIESQFRGVDHGRSHRVDELKALGNGVIPAVVAEFLRRNT